MMTTCDGIDALISLVPQNMTKYLVAVSFCGDCQWLEASPEVSVRKARDAYDRGEVELATGVLFSKHDDEGAKIRVGFALYSIPRKYVAVRFLHERFNQL